MTPAPTHRRPLHHRALNVIAPPLSHRLHGTYHGRHPMHIWFDTTLSAILIVMIGINVLAWVRQHNIVDSGLASTLAVPSTITAGTTTTVSISLNNTDSQPIQNLTVAIDYPAGWHVSSTTIAPTTPDKNSWAFGRLEGKHVVGLSIVGRLIAAVDTSDVMTAHIRYTQNGKQQEDILQNRLTVTRSPLTVEIDGPATIASGQPASIIATVTNNSHETQEHVQIVVAYPTQFQQPRPSPVAFEDTNIWVLDSMAAGQTSTFTLTGVPITSRDQSLHFTGEVSLIEQEHVAWQATAGHLLAVTAPNSIAEVIDSPPGQRPTFVVEAHYYSASGQQFGYGPLPPKVGATTAYRIFWVVQPGTTASSNVSVSATLPADVQWSNNQSITGGKTLSYDATTRVVTWSIGDMSAGLANMSGSFEVTITPRAADVGQAKMLVQGSTLTSTVKGQTTHQTAPAVDTRINEAQAASQGLVQR